MSLLLYSPFCQYEDVKCWYSFKFQNFLVQYIECNRACGTRLRNLPENNVKGSYKHMFYLFLFMKCKQLFVLILCYLITFKKDAQNDHLKFQGKSVDLSQVLPWIQLHAEWFLMLLIAKFTDRFVPLWMLVFQHFQ